MTCVCVCVCFTLIRVPRQDSLGKFVGRTLQECGEDLLVEISEILFNELAFFRLMQDLDNSSSSAAKNRTKRSRNAVSTKHTNKTEVCLCTDGLGQPTVFFFFSFSLFLFFFVGGNWV